MVLLAEAAQQHGRYEAAFAEMVRLQQETRSLRSCGSARRCATPFKMVVLSLDCPLCVTVLLDSSLRTRWLS